MALRKITGKYLVLFLLLTIALGAKAQRRATMVIGDGECYYDTLVYRQAGPGFTYSRFQFGGIKFGSRTYKMRMYLYTVDLTNPYIKISPYLAKGSYYSIQRQNNDVTRMKQENLKPIATMMGGGFVQHNNTTDTTTAYEIYNSLVGDGRIYFDAGTNLQKFSVGDDKIARVAATHMIASMTYGSLTMKIGQVNHYREVGNALAAASLYCNGIPKSVSANPFDGYEVRLRVNTNNGIIMSGANSCTVIEKYDGCGHNLNSGEAIISAVGDNAAALKTLNIGDEVTVSISYNCGDTKDVNVQAQSTVMVQHGMAVCDGEPVENSEALVAGCAIGCSKDGKTAYLADLEISQYSDAPYKALECAMSNFGVWNAIWLDGGPSAEMTLDGDYITTSSIGEGFNGRYVASAIAIMSTAPEDNNIQSIAALDPTTQSVNVGGTLSPQIYGYNQYGEMINADVAKSSYAEMTCSEGLGTTSNGVFTATNEGTGYIRITLRSTQQTIVIPIVVNKARKLVIYPQKLFTGEGRDYQAKLTIIDGNTVSSLEPSSAIWSTNASYVISGCDGGDISPMIDGDADVYAKYMELTDTMEVTVENLDNEETDEISYKSEVDGMVKTDQHLQSVPTSFRITVESAPESTVTVFYTTCDSIRSASAKVPQSGLANIDVALDYEAADTYPVSVDYINGTSQDNLPGYTSPFVVRDLIAYYHFTGPSGISEITADTPEDSESSTVYNLYGMRVTSSYHGIIIRCGKKCFK